MNYAGMFSTKSEMKAYSPLRDGLLQAEFGPLGHKDALLGLATNCVIELYKGGLWDLDEDIVLVGQVAPDKHEVFPSADEVLEDINERISYSYGQEDFFQPTAQQKNQLETLLAGAFRQWMHDCEMEFSFGPLSSVEAYAFDGQQLSKVDREPEQDFVKKAVQEASEVYKSAGVEF